MCIAPFNRLLMALRMYNAYLGFFIVALLMVTSIKAENILNSTKEMKTSYPAPTGGDKKLFFNFLYWYASQESSSLWANIYALKSLTSSRFYAKGFSFDWSGGFRTGIGYEFVNKSWDTQLYWTWFHTKARSQIPRDKGLVLTEFYVGFIKGDLAASGKLEWNLLLNMFDWELGRSFWITKCASLRPFVGIKGGLIDQTIQSHWKNIRNSSLNSPFSSSEKLVNNFRGIGPSFGVNGKWNLGHRLTHFLNIFGDFSSAMLWGNWICTDVYRNSTASKSTIYMNNSQLGAWMMRGLVGIGWESDFNQHRSHVAIRLGYELQYWLNQLRIPTFQQLRLHGDLTLQGGTFDCRFDF